MGRAMGKNIVVTVVASLLLIATQMQGATEPNTTDPNVRGVLDDLAEDHEFIIVDSTPVLDFAVSQELARVVDVCLLVARARRPAAPVVEAVEMLESAGGTVAGIVVNDVLPEDRVGAEAAVRRDPAGQHHPLVTILFQIL